MYETQTRFSLNLVPESYTPFGLVYPAVVAGCSPARDVNGKIFSDYIRIRSGLEDFLSVCIQFPGIQYP